MWPGLGGGQLLQVLQRRGHIQQLLVESQGKVKVHHGGVVDGQAANDPDQVEPFLLNEALKIIIIRKEKKKKVCQITRDDEPELSLSPKQQHFNKTSDPDPQLLTACLWK